MVIDNSGAALHMGSRVISDMPLFLSEPCPPRLNEICARRVRWSASVETSAESLFQGDFQTVSPPGYSNDPLDDILTSLTRVRNHD